MTTYTIRFSNMVFHDWISRGILSSLRGEGHKIRVLHKTKRDVVIRIGEETLTQFIYDLKYQIEVIVANGADGDASMKPVFQRALSKFVEAKQNERATQ